MIAVKDTHQHYYEDVIEKKILLTSGLQAGFDIILLRKCKCGKTQAFDIKERTVV